MLCLFSLADLELWQHDLDPMKDPSACSQYCALRYRQISARMGHAVAKASIMRLLGLPRLPVSHPVPRSILARNCPGPLDTFCSRNPALFSIKGTQKLGKQ